MRRIGLGVGAVAVVVAGAFAFTLIGGGPTSPEPGVCAHIERVDEGARYRALDCGSEHANVRVAKVVEDGSQCPKGGAPYTIFTRSATLCLIPNFVEGACYQGDRTAGMRRVDCTTAQAVRVASAAREPAECANGRKVTYPEPAVTFCLVPADMR
ncbi:LppU/SCO3897 family protein [Saccharothrix stipae]